MKCSDRPDGRSEARPIRTKNGDLFLVQDDGDLLALGLIARGNNRAIKLGYFFDPSNLCQFNNVDRMNLSASDAIYIAKFSYLHLKNGKWPIVGHLADFSRETWPMPVFQYRNILTNIMQYRMYDEEKLEYMIGEYDEFSIEDYAKSSIMASDGLDGAIYVENFLRGILNNLKNSLN
ncbi:hypothetical protein C3941_06360 [Kaistia algarum]|uniref:Imm26 family immunity protein n=1 Tax=Kaistia algarum TaxID=2083279 RepID=UPI000CE76B4D|nr:Imm26 family immunity protein [Kaistia algarum]MCX5515704.1 Imm26 family immunity protein [Kaistia algarum]PPE80916.1 hypothetical protein C3941_06360 [Kaistia algarum]